MRRREQQTGAMVSAGRSHHLLDDGVEIGRVALSQASVYGGIVRQPLERPRQ